MLTPEQRSQRARIAALARWAKEDAAHMGHRGTAGLMRRWGAEVDEAAAANGEVLTPQQRLRRVETLQKLHMQRLAFNSSKARAARKNAATGSDAA
jgi:hypothetical protein